MALPQTERDDLCPLAALLSRLEPGYRSEHFYFTVHHRFRQSAVSGDAGIDAGRCTNGLHSNPDRLNLACVGRAHPHSSRSHSTEACTSLLRNH